MESPLGLLHTLIKHFTAVLLMLFHHSKWFVLQRISSYIRFGESWYSYSLRTNVDMNLDFVCLLFYFLTAHDFQNSTLKKILLSYFKVDNVEIWEQQLTVNILRSNVLKFSLNIKTCDLLISGLVFTTSAYLGLEVTPPFLHVPHGLLPSKVYILHH